MLWFWDIFFIYKDLVDILWLIVTTMNMVFATSSFSNSINKSRVDSIVIKLVAEIMSNH